MPDEALQVAEAEAREHLEKWFLATVFVSDRQRAVEVINTYRDAVRATEAARYREAWKQAIAETFVDEVAAELYEAASVRALAALAENPVPAAREGVTK